MQILFKVSLFVLAYMHITEGSKQTSLDRLEVKLNTENVLFHLKEKTYFLNGQYLVLKKKKKEKVDFLL